MAEQPHIDCDFHVSLPSDDGEDEGGQTCGEGTTRTVAGVSLPQV
jgi:hypothetical protein